MPYVRKTQDEWQLWIDYGQGWEYETAEYTRKEIKQRQKEYRENCPEYPTKIKCVRVPLVKCSNCESMLSLRESLDVENTEVSCVVCWERIHGTNPYK